MNDKPIDPAGLHLRTLAKMYIPCEDFERTKNMDRSEQPFFIFRKLSKEYNDYLRSEKR